MRFPTMDIKMKDPYYMAEQIEKLQEEQKNVKKMYNFLAVNIGDLALEVKELRSDLDKERHKSDETRANIDDISAKVKEAEQKVERVHVVVSKVRGNVEDSMEATATTVATTAATTAAASAAPTVAASAAPTATASAATSASTTAATIDTPQINSSARDLGCETYAGIHQSQSMYSENLPFHVRFKILSAFQIVMYS